MPLSTRWKIILFCVAYNLLFEFSGKGITGFSYTVLWLILPFIYISFFAVMVHVADVSSGSERALLGAAATFGVIPATFITGVLFYSPTLVVFFGLGFVLFILWWGILQTLIPMYMTAKYFGFEISNGKLKSRDWYGIIFFWLIVIVSVSLAGVSMQGSLGGYFISLLFFILFLFWTRFEIVRVKNCSSGIESSNSPFPTSRLLDFGFWGTIIINLFCGFVITPMYPNPVSPSSNASILVHIIWSIILGLIVVIYKLRSKQPIPLPGLKHSFL